MKDAAASRNKWAVKALNMHNRAMRYQNRIGRAKRKDKDHHKKSSSDQLNPGHAQGSELASFRDDSSCEEDDDEDGEEDDEDEEDDGFSGGKYCYRWLRDDG